jgi:hypothetical protein
MFVTGIMTRSCAAATVCVCVCARVHTTRVLKVRCAACCSLGPAGTSLGIGSGAILKVCLGLLTTVKCMLSACAQWRSAGGEWHALLQCLRAAAIPGIKFDRSWQGGVQPAAARALQVSVSNS